MFVNHVTPQICSEMSRPAAQPPAPSYAPYRLRRLARYFAFAGAATLVYATALVAIALQSAIIEF